MKKLLKQKNKAFTLVETLVAISIFSMSILGLLSILASSISDTSYARQKITADYLAQEGIEYLRNTRDTYILYPTNGNWNTFKNKLSSCDGHNFCGFDDSISETSANAISLCSVLNNCKLYVNNGNYNTNLSGNDSGFVRKIWMTPVGVDEIKIFSEVDWTQGSGGHTVTFSEDLFNWTE